MFSSKESGVYTTIGFRIAGLQEPYDRCSPTITAKCISLGHFSQTP